MSINYKQLKKIVLNVLDKVEKSFWPNKCARVFFGGPSEQECDAAKKAKKNIQRGDIVEITLNILSGNQKLAGKVAEKVFGNRYQIFDKKFAAELFKKIMKPVNSQCMFEESLDIKSCIEFVRESMQGFVVNMQDINTNGK